MRPSSTLFAAAALLAAASAAAESAPSLRLVDGPPSGPAVVVRHDGPPDMGRGNTSVSNVEPPPLKTGGEGYFVDGREVSYVKRNRDLGQTFLAPGTRCLLAAVGVRTGFGSAAVRPGMFGRAVSLQVFAVAGEPVLHDNGTPAGTPAAHGWPHRYPNIEHFRDDFQTGETFALLATVRGFRFPERGDFGLGPAGEVSADDPRLKGRWLRFDFAGEGPVLEPGRRYGFLVLVDEPGEDAAFALANRCLGEYPDGHGIRREGDGTFPPAPADPGLPVGAPENARALAAALLPRGFAARSAIPPGTNGYPDVDTFRDLVFWIEGAPVQEAPRPSDSSR